MINIYTDGGCLTNEPNRIGAFYFIIFRKINEKTKDIMDSYRKFISGEEKNNKYNFINGGDYEINTTNNKMEIKAAIESLKELDLYIKENNIDISEEEIFLYSDSMYLINGITRWIDNWKNNDWKTYNGFPVKNREIWEELDKYKIKFKKLNFVWVKGHNSDIFNIECDASVQKLINKALELNNIKKKG